MQSRAVAVTAAVKLFRIVLFDMIFTPMFRDSIHTWKAHLDDEECERRGLTVGFIRTRLRSDLNVSAGENVHDIKDRLITKCRQFTCPRDSKVSH